MKMDESNSELLELHSEKVRNTIDKIPASLFYWGIVINLMVFVVLVLVLCFLSNGISCNILEK